jgi:hypothetical protein
MVQLKQTAVPAQCSFLPGGHICRADIESKKGRGHHRSSEGRETAADHCRLRPALFSWCVHWGWLLADQSTVQWNQVSEVMAIPLHIYCPCASQAVANSLLWVMVLTDHWNWRDNRWRLSCPCNGLWRHVRLLAVEAPAFSRQSSHRWWWGCQPYALALCPLLPGRFMVLISARRVRSSVVVKALCYELESHGFDIQWGEFLNLPNPSGRTRPWGLLSL